MKLRKAKIAQKRKKDPTPKAVSRGKKEMVSNITKVLVQIAAIPRVTSGFVSAICVMNMAIRVDA